MPAREKHRKTGLRAIALFEALKGMVVLAAGLGILAFIHQDLHGLAVEFLQTLHLNPARSYAKVFLDAVDHVTDGKLWLLAGLATLYSAGRFIEGYGLWEQRRWAEWFGAIAGGIYVPIEIYELILKLTWFRVAVLLINIAVVAYLALDLYLSRKRKDATTHDPAPDQQSS